MSTLSVRLPKSIHEQLKELAAEEGVSMNQFISIALAEKIASIKTLKYLEERAKRGSREQLLELLAKAPDVEPEEYDRLD
jgi:hypothetical protein